MAKILIVDDDPELTRIAAFFLKKAGHRVVQANKISQARAELCAEFDLAIIDGTLEKPLDGYQFALSLKTGFTDPILVLMVSAEIEDTPEFERLTKPVTNEELLAKVTEMLARKT